MRDLKQIVLDSEDRIVREVMDAARTQGYGRHIPALEGTYRLAVSTISANIVQVLSVAGDVPALRADGWTKWEAANLSAWSYLGVDPRTIFRHLEKLEAERRGETLPDPDGEDEVQQ